MTSDKTQWTVLTYIAAHNNLEQLGRRSLNQILGVGSTPQMRLAVLYDRHDGATRYIAGEPGLTVVEEPLSYFDSGDPDALLETVRWAFEQCPAEHYALILWSHGSGWRPEEVERVARQARGDKAVSSQEATERAIRPGAMALFRSTLAQLLKPDSPTERAICFDDGSGHSLDSLELERVVREVQVIIGQPLDLLGMDACVMATLEVAYQVRPYVRYLVASEELVPGYSWPYDTILEALYHRPEMCPRDLATLIVQHYAAYYTAHPPALNAGDVTKVALDLARIDEIVEAANRLAEALLGDIEEQTACLWAAQRQTRGTETQQHLRQHSKFDYHLWDIRTLAAQLAVHSSNPTVRETARLIDTSLQIGSAVISEEHRGDWFNGIGGISIYAVPPGIQRISPYYSQVALAQNTRWAEMLQAYHQAIS